MANFDSLRYKRKKEQKVRLTVSISKQAFDSLMLMCEAEPDKTPSSITGDALRFAFAHDMYNLHMQNTASMAIAPARKPAKTSAESKQDWCIKYGGRIDGNTCYYNKYERTLTGELYRSEQGLPLTQMPSSEDDFRKMVLGNFQSVSQAEYEYEKDKAEDAEPVKMLGKNKK